MNADKVVILDDGSMVELFSSEDPSIWFALSSDGVTRYRITGVWTANPHCHCPARIELCRHLRGVITMVLEEHAMSEQQSTDLVAASPAVVAATNANNALLAIRGQVESYKYALEFCDMYAAEAQIPDKFGKNKGTMAAVLLRGVELGLPFGMAMELMYVVNGSPAIMAQAVQGLVERSGKGWIEIVESTPDYAIVVGHREGRPDMEVKWTKEQAVKAGSKEIGGWTDKLVWKAIARVGRRQFPDVLGGLDVGDGGGQVIDRMVVGEQENEYNVEVEKAAPAVIEPAKPSIEAPKSATPPGTMAELKAALAERGIKANLVLDFLNAHKPTGWAGKDAPIERGDIIEAVEAYCLDNKPCEVVELVTDAQAWDASGRPADDADDLFDEGEWRDPSQETPQGAAPGVESPSEYNGDVSPALDLALAAQQV